MNKDEIEYQESADEFMRELQALVQKKGKRPAQEAITLAATMSRAGAMMLINTVEQLKREKPEIGLNPFIITGEMLDALRADVASMLARSRGEEDPYEDADPEDFAPLADVGNTTVEECIREHVTVRQILNDHVAGVYPISQMNAFAIALIVQAASIIGQGEDSPQAAAHRTISVLSAVAHMVGRVAFEHLPPAPEAS